MAEVIDYGLAALLIVILLTQVVLPGFTSLPLFWWFRGKKPDTAGLELKLLDQSRKENEHALRQRLCRK